MGAWSVLLGGLMLCGGQEPGAFEQRKRAEPPPAPVPLIPIPIPTGVPDPPPHAARFEWSLSGTVTSYAHRTPDGVWTERASDRVSRYDDPDGQNTDSSVTKWFARRNLKGNRVTGVGMAHKVYLADAWDGRVEVEATPRGPRLRVSLNYWVVDGTAVGVALDSRRGLVLQHERHLYNDEIGLYLTQAYIRGLAVIMPAWERFDPHIQYVERIVVALLPGSK